MGTRTRELKGAVDAEVAEHIVQAWEVVLHSEGEEDIARGGAAGELQLVFGVPQLPLDLKPVHDNRADPGILEPYAHIGEARESAL